MLGLARIYDMLNDQEQAIATYKRVLALDSSNIESIACLGAHYFYSDQVGMTSVIGELHTIHLMRTFRFEYGSLCFFGKEKIVRDGMSYF